MSEPAEREFPFGTFERVCGVLADQGGEQLSVFAALSTSAIFHLDRALGDVLIAVVRFSPEMPEYTRAQLADVIKAAKATAADIILVGGDKAARRMLKKARPFYSAKRIGLVHIDDALGVWTQNPTAAGKLLLPLESKLASTTFDESDWRALEQLSEQTRRDHDQGEQELQAFATIVKQRKPVMTWAIAALIGAVFGFELFIGSSTSTVGLARMGALMPERVIAGEWWRLISCTFLHAGWMHVLFNVYVLIILGTFLERIIGPARFLLLYATSAVAGSIGSALFLKANISVGASGAVWGLLGAHAILAYRSDGLLPQALIAGARRAATINLVINVLNSFRPFVDKWAHFAGGAAGAGLFALVLTRGIPRFEGAHAGERDFTARVPTSKALWVAGMGSAVVLIAGLGLGLFFGNPLALKTAPQMKRTELTELGVSVMLPAGLKRKVLTNPVGGKELMFGDALSSPMTVTVWTLRLPAKLTPEGLRNEIDSLKKSLPTPAKAKVHIAAQEIKINGELGLKVSYRYPSGLIYERAFLFRGALMVRIEVLRWPGFPIAAPPGSAQKIVETVAPLDKG